MPIFTNIATLSYNGNVINSNTVTGRIEEVLTATKTAVIDEYTANDNVTYVVSLVNSGSSALEGITVMDNLGAYDFEGTVLVPLEYTEGSIQYYVNGAIQSAPTVKTEDNLVIRDITVPAGGNAMLIYQVSLNEYAPLGTDESITNEIIVSGEGLCSDVIASETISTADELDLSITKALDQSVVTCDSEITYTFTIQNFGNVPATCEDDLVLSDTFSPVLYPITVTFEGEEWTEGENYVYDELTGEFASVAGQITVPAATYAQDENGVWVVTPGVSTLTVTGTVNTAN